MTDLRAQLQTTLGDGYTLERELGGGGMSRVFVARENALGRTVVVKVIAPELAEGVSAERFAREVKLAARLQQANIVPVLSTGSSGSLPYYTMPFVSGESLRARLAGGTRLTVSQECVAHARQPRECCPRGGEYVAHAGWRLDRHTGVHGARAGRGRRGIVPTSTHGAWWRTNCWPVRIRSPARPTARR